MYGDDANDTISTIGIRCHVSANGPVVPPMILRYWHDRRVGKGTNQHGNRFALSTYVLLLLLRFTTTVTQRSGSRLCVHHSTQIFASARHRAHLVTPPRRCAAYTGPLPVC